LSDALLPHLGLQQPVGSIRGIKDRTLPAFGLLSAIFHELPHARLLGGVWLGPFYDVTLTAFSDHLVLLHQQVDFLCVAGQIPVSSEQFVQVTGCAKKQSGGGKHGSTSPSRGLIL
jgi:hypothetical protein